MWQEFGQMHYAACLLRFGCRDYLIDLLLGWHTAQQSQNCAHLSHINELIAMMIEYAKCVRNAFL